MLVGLGNDLLSEEEFELVLDFKDHFQIVVEVTVPYR